MFKLSKENKFKNQTLNKNISKKVKAIKCISAITIIPILFISAIITLAATYNNIKIIITNNNYSHALNLENEIIQKTVALARTLNIDSPIELCSFTEQLIKGGALSYNKTYKYDKTVDHLDITGNLSLDIVKGTGVCRHESNLMVKIARAYGYKAYSLVNDLIVDNKLGRHAYTLIVENDEAYIYDVTNDEIFLFDDLNNTTSICDLSKSKTDILNSIINGYLPLYEIINLTNTMQSGNKTPIKDLVLEQSEGYLKYFKHLNLIDKFEKTIHNEKISIMKEIDNDKVKELKLLKPES